MDYCKTNFTFCVRKALGPETSELFFVTIAERVGLFQNFSSRVASNVSAGFLLPLSVILTTYIKGYNNFAKSFLQRLFLAKQKLCKIVKSHGVFIILQRNDPKITFGRN